MLVQAPKIPIHTMLFTFFSSQQQEEGGDNAYELHLFSYSYYERYLSDIYEQ